MKLHHISEPDLEFGKARHICPRSGIAQHAVYDSRLSERRNSILVGGVGTSQTLEKLDGWLDRCKRVVPAKLNSRQPNLHREFCGFHIGLGFMSTLISGENITRLIHNADMREVLDMPTDTQAQWNRCVEAAVEMYYARIKFLAQNRAMVDVIVCVLPDELHEKIATRKRPSSEDSIEPTPEEEEDDAVEVNFRRLLKARAMHLGKPLQLARESTLGENPNGSGDQQDDATRAWNFCTALYYKANKTVPWRMPPRTTQSDVCFVGVSFYRSRDYKSLHTSLAQIFDELGNGVILRGTPVDVNKDKFDRRPYMTEEQAYDLLKRALDEYNIALDTRPARLVIHKSSKFHPEEMRGFKRILKESHVRSVDFVTILDSRLRLLRDGAYPPLRGTHLEIDPANHLLYTRGSVPFYKTYPGLYIPQPLEIRIVESEVSPAQTCAEILSLTKMNWNSTQFDGKYPITLLCARKVGEILKYLPPEVEPQISYSFYM